MALGVPRRHTVRSVPEPPPRRVPTTDFDRVAAAIPLPELYAMFTGKATMEAVRAWRRNTRPTPAWAFEVLRNRLQMDADAANERLADLDRVKKESR